MLEQDINSVMELPMYCVHPQVNFFLDGRVFMNSYQLREKDAATESYWRNCDHWVTVFICTLVSSIRITSDTL